MDIAVFIDGDLDANTAGLHSATAGDLITLQFLSPNGSLDGAAFTSFLQIIPTGFPPLPNAILPVHFGPALPTAILVDGLSQIGGLFVPAIGLYQVSGLLPPFLGGSGSSLLVNCVVIDLGINPFNLGVANGQQIDIQ